MNRILAALLLSALSVTASAEVWQARYGVAETFNFRLYNADGTLDVDEADGGTEVSLSCNEGAETTATNDFVDEGTFYSIALTAAELQCERVAVVVAATTTEVFFIQTVNNVSAMTPQVDGNLVNIAGSAVSTSTAQLGVNVVNAAGTAWGSGAITAASIATDAIGAAEIAADAIGASELATGAITTAEFAAGAINAAAIASDAIGAAEVAADVSTELLSGLANLAVNVAQISGDSGAADALETAFDGTAGAVSPLGIARQGTAQSATGTTLVLDSSASFGDDTAIGMTLVACGSTQGYCQARAVTDYVSSTDTATVETWTVTPSGTITYYLFSTAPSSGGGGLDAAGVRAAVGLASANLDTQLGTIDTNVDAVLVDTSTTLDDLVDDLESRLGTPSNLGGGATVAANLSDIEGQTDDIGVAGAGLTATDDSVMTRLGAPAGASVSADIAAIEAQTDDIGAAGAGLTALASASALSTVDTVVDTIQVTTDKLDDTLELDSTVYRFTANSLETAPTGSGESLDAIADAVWDELLSGHAVSGSTGEALTSASAGGGLDAAGVRAAIGLATANLDTQLSGIQSDTDALQSAIAALNNLSSTQVRDLVIEDQGGGVTLGCALSVLLAYASGDVVTSGASSTYEDPSGTETRATGTVTSNGNRTATITCPTY